MFHFETPHDIVLATGRQITVRNFVKMCLSYAEEEVEWQGKGIEERGITKSTVRCIMDIESEYRYL